MQDDPIQAAREAAERAISPWCDSPSEAVRLADAAVIAFLRALPGDFPIPAILAAAVERAGEKGAPNVG